MTLSISRIPGYFDGFVPRTPAFAGHFERLGKFDGEEVEISVIDSGCGIPGQIQGRIFDPFVSTKKSAAKCGLGLSISKDLVESHGGSNALDPTSKETRFVLRLPRIFV